MAPSLIIPEPIPPVIRAAGATPMHALAQTLNMISHNPFRPFDVSLDQSTSKIFKIVATMQQSAMASTARYYCCTNTWGNNLLRLLGPRLHVPLEIGHEVPKGRHQRRKQVVVQQLEVCGVEALGDC